MEESKQKITIMDVARLAGVSKGTVDRVLHNRGEVSRKSEEKVRKVIAELGYEPNLYASLLASKKKHSIACLLPEYEKGEYWERIKEGLDKSEDRLRQFNVQLELFSYEQYSTDSFKDACNALIESEPSAVILPPLFKNDTRLFTSDLVKKEIPYIFIDTKIEDDGYFAYFGMPMYQSGYLCAHLLTDRMKEEEVKEVALVRIQRDKARQSDPTINRRAGFMDYLSEHYPNCIINNIFINPSSPEETECILNEYFKEHEFKFVVMLNSRIHLISDFLPQAKRSGNTRVVGFDDLEKNMHALHAGDIDILITQHTENQSFNAVQCLIDYLLMHKAPAKKDNFMHMDILTRLNSDYY